MGGEDPIIGSKKVQEKFSNDDIDSLHKDLYAKALSTSSSSSSQNSLSSSQNSTPLSTTSTLSSNSTSFLAPSQVKIDTLQWSTIEWFGHGDDWKNDFVRWIILALEEKEEKESNSIERGLTVIKRETNEIFGVEMIDLDCYNFCIDLITKCSIARLDFDKKKRNELLRDIFDHLQMEFDQANLLIKTLGQMSSEQRSVLRFMTHQKIQARIAFLRTTLKTQKTIDDMEGYHCTTNPYYKNLREGIKAVKASNTDLNKKYGDIVNLYNELSVENKKLLEKTKKLEAENDQLSSQTEQIKQESFVKELIENCAKITQERENKLKLEHEAHIKEIQERNDRIKSEHEAHIKESKESNDKIKLEYEAHIKRLQEHNDKIKSEYEEHINQFQEEAEELRKEAKSAQKEASNYQAALGSATNVRWSDSTLNNPIQLTKDIEKFQHSLTDFTKVKGKSYKINENAAKQLLVKYGCKANPNDREIKNYLAAALQRMILETIFHNAENLYKYANYAGTFTDGHLESFIVYYNHHLVRYTNLLTTNREGKDSITAITPIKIRQQVYAALGSRGFATSNHSQIKKLVSEILGKMEKYREVVDEEKKKELNSEAEKIIRTGMQLWFCLKAQEPVPKIQWFKPGARIETHLMVGSWENENVKEMELDFAFFPLIITEHDNQVFNKAQVFVRPKQTGTKQTGRFQQLKKSFLGGSIF
ncbi:hypothetical protein C1645_880460 [Glomus cerebriforme]|uniref:Uncharacterized protein n=1 Tax=Glomus cerebriforme TaxID=658196 RepID=A0A397SLQ3_9GLOM|nr:hypothetical protein C1645_880460 [Glomus cerebriforme]